MTTPSDESNGAEAAAIARANQDDHRLSEDLADDDTVAQQLDADDDTVAPQLDTDEDPRAHDNDETKLTATRPRGAGSEPPD